MMGEPVYVGRAKKFRGSPEEKKTNFESHNWEKITKSYLWKSGSYETWKCSDCGAEFGNHEVYYLCGSEPDRYTEYEVENLLF